MPILLPSITKMSGAGNLFLLIDLRCLKNPASKIKEVNWHISRPQLAHQLCQSDKGFCADGLLFIEDSAGSEDFQWDFYNADGSQAEMCGNAARCVALYVFKKGNKSRKMIFKTLAGPIKAHVLNHNHVEVGMSPIQKEKRNLKISVEGCDLIVDWVDTGVPHLTVSLDTHPFLFISPDERTRQVASRLRNHPVLGSIGLKGQNVSLYRIRQPGCIEAISYERGVEDFTQACGTGAVAAAWSYHQNFPQQKAVKVNMPGGLLEVDFSNMNPLLRGEARFLAEIQLSQDYFS